MDSTVFHPCMLCRCSVFLSSSVVCCIIVHNACNSANIIDPDKVGPIYLSYLASLLSSECIHIRTGPFRNRTHSWATHQWWPGDKTPKVSSNWGYYSHCVSESRMSPTRWTKKTWIVDSGFGQVLEHFTESWTHDNECRVALMLNNGCHKSEGWGGGDVGVELRRKSGYTLWSVGI